MQNIELLSDWNLLRRYAETVGSTSPEGNGYDLDKQRCMGAAGTQCPGPAATFSATQGA